MKKFYLMFLAISMLAQIGFCERIPDGYITVSIAKEEAKEPLSEEEQAEQNITTDTEGEEQKPPEISLEIPGKAEKEFIKAEKNFRKAVMAYSEGKKEKAEKYFNDATSRIGEIALSADVNFYLKDQFEELFLKINELIYKDEPSSTSQAYQIPIESENEAVKQYLSLYSKGESKRRIENALERSGQYRDMIFSVLKKYNLPKELIYLPVVESLYNVNCLSRAGALGLWQFMPHTARGFGLKVNYWIDERKDPEKATVAAARYLRDLYILFDDWHLALAAYNRGEFGLGRDMQFSQAINIEQFKNRKAVPKETENYVPQFIAVTIIGDNPKQYGYKIKFENPVEYDEITINDVIDLKIAAECAKTDINELRELNPAIMAWCTPPNYPEFKLKLPKGTKETFLANLAQVKDLNPSKGYIKYKVRQGDWLEKIASKFYTSVRAIKEDNKKQLYGKKYLRIGTILIIRPGRKYFKNQ